MIFKDKTVIITGASEGVGAATARMFAEAGANLMLVARTKKNLEAVAEQLRDKSRVEIFAMDVADAEACVDLFKKTQFEFGQVDILINNAGILRRDQFGSIDYDTMLEQYQVNTLGPLRVCEALADNLHEGSKVAIVTSRVGSIEDNGSGGNWGYRASKTAVNMIGTNLMHQLKPSGIAVALLHPGLVATDMTSQHGISPADSASGLIDRIDELNMSNSGSFWHAEGYALPW